MTYGVHQRPGPHWPITPPMNGPSPNPAYINIPTSRAVHIGSAAPSSCIQALATTNTMPDTAPSRNRPANSNATLSAPAIITSDATPDSSMPGTITRLRPSTSDIGPAYVNAGARPIG